MMYACLLMRSLYSWRCHTVLCMEDHHQAICDMITRNKLDVGDIGLEILAKTVFKFFCFILFLALINNS